MRIFKETLFCRAGIPALLLAIAVVGCQPGGPDAKNAKGEFGKEAKRPPLIIPVEVASPTRGDMSSYFDTSTRIEAERRVDVSSKGSARCIALLVDEGDTVSQGDILAELERAEAQALYDQSSIQVRQNETSYALAKRQHDEGLGTKMDMDNAKYTHEQSLATLESQRLALENLTIRAPIDGVITTRVIHLGMLVSVGESVFSIMDPSSFILTISPPEKELSRLKIGQTAEVRVDAIPGRLFSASIRRINPSVDPVTGTIKVVLDFDEELDGELRESAFSRVKLVMSTRKNVILIPKEAIVEENGKQYVFVLEETDGETVTIGGKSSDLGASDSKKEVEASEKGDEEDAKPDSTEVPVYVAKRVSIQTALEDATRIQVFAGLEESALMVTNGQHSLKDGAKVRISSVQQEISRLEGMSADDLLEVAKKKRSESGEDVESGGKGGGGLFVE